MSDLIAFLTARTDEGETHANAMGHWTDSSEAYSCPATRTEPLGDLPWGEEHCDCGLAERKARALREVAARRVIVELARKARLWTEGPAGATAGYASAIIGDSLRALASIDSDHPDYRQEWTVE